MLNNCRYDEFCNLEVTVTIPKWYQRFCQKGINQPGNKYYVRCGNVIVSVPYGYNVTTAVMAGLLGQEFEHAESDMVRALSRDGVHDLAKLDNKDEPRIIRLLPYVWISNDRQIIEEVQVNPDDRNKLNEIEKMFLAITGQERL